MKTQYRVTADIEYLDGALSEMIIPHGFGVNYPTERLAQKCACFLERVRQDDDFIRAAVTGNRYKVRGFISINRIGIDG